MDQRLAAMLEMQRAGGAAGPGALPGVLPGAGAGALDAAMERLLARSAAGGAMRAGDLHQMMQQMDLLRGDIRAARRDLQRQAAGAGPEAQRQPQPQRAGAAGLSVRSVAVQDPAMTIRYTQSPDGSRLLATRRDGQVLFDGPVDTAQQVAAVPEAVRQRLPAGVLAGK
jgi:hypothetical protein